MSGKEEGYTHSKLLTVSGADGQAGGTRTNFKINLGTNVQKVSRVSIASVTFPNNAYNVNDTGGGANNTFGFVDVNLGEFVEFEVDPGFYTTTTLMSAVQTAINAWLSVQGYGQSITLSQDSISQLVSVTYTAGTGSSTVSLEDAKTGSTTYSGIWELLGFVPSVTVSASTPSVATNLPNLGGLKEVFLQSNILASGNMFATDGTQKNTVIAIPVTAPFGASNVFECKQDALCQISYMTPRTLTDIDFYLTDRNGNIIDLHGGNLTINLRIWFNRY